MGKLRGIVRGHAAATAERGDPVDPPGDEPSQIRRTSVLGARPVDREGLRKEWTALHTFADAAWARGTLPLIGAPLLAVVATFVLQPKASGSYQDPSFVSEAPAADSAAGESWVAVQQALDARHFGLARALLAEPPAEPAARADWQAYTLMLQCLEHPSKESSSAAERYYLAGAPADVRASLLRTCLSTP